MKSSRILYSHVRQAVRDELTSRAEARAGLEAFTRRTMAGYRCGAHHRLLCARLDAVARGEITRLMVFMPPRHGKSELISRRFPAWYLGQYPDRQVICAAYSATLAQDFGRTVRNLVASPGFTALFPAVSLAADSAARDTWHTAAGGSYTATGTGGGLTGRGAHLALIDDPVKDRQEAESPLRRQAVWEWYRSVLRTRLMPGGAIVLAMTRWSPDDLAGRLLADMKNGTGEAWEVLSLPAMAEEQETPDALGRLPGAVLWPEAFAPQALHDLRLAVGEREWSALYQQRPVPAEGHLFSTALMTVHDALPAQGQSVRRWDLAATTRNRSDWTAGVKMTRLPDGRYAVADVVRLRGDPAQVEAALLATASQDGAATEIILPQDPGQAGVAQVRYLAGRLAGYRVRAVRETGDKATRAAPFAAQVNAGNVLVQRAPWTAHFLEELSLFPAGGHDDQVDAAAGAFAALAGTVALPQFSPAFLSHI
ncbi:phage terminase large subunit [Acetobacter sp. DsW_059]|uniref:phage terminase large subunit n=1 Tax=Acetobacter sp. DsW_059 TaxID=1670661 RepID=UPI000A3797E9|nr:phage terminase large subunit [Acetobacter sp. DsW_059]OUJ11832.1 terminase [Acetobacter sp. DsW_059]